MSNDLTATPRICVTKSIFGGIQKLYSFPNGYGASVVCHKGSYGGKQGLWELAIIFNGEICYDTTIANDVVGYLNDEQVEDYLNKIEALVIVDVESEIVNDVKLLENT